MPEKYDRCVSHLMGRKGVRNPYAVCNAAGAGKGGKKRKKKRKGGCGGGCKH